VVLIIEDHITGTAGAKYGSWPQRKMKLFQGDPSVGVSYKKNHLERNMPRIFFVFILLTAAQINAAVASEVDLITSRPLTFACSDWAPITFQDDNNMPRGLYIEILREVIEKRLKKKIDVKIRPWKRVQFEVEHGFSDFMITVSTPKRLEYSIKGKEPFFLFSSNIYTYADHPKFKEINRIETVMDIAKLDLLAVTNLGNEWHHNNIENFGVRTHMVKAEENALMFLAAKRADIMIDAIVPTNFLIVKNKLSSKIILTRPQLGQVVVFLLMSKKSPYVKMMPQYNQAFLGAKNSGVIDKIIRKYSKMEQ